MRGGTNIRAMAYLHYRCISVMERTQHNMTMFVVPSVTIVLNITICLPIAAPGI
jgi:hypothetical protein